MTQTTLREYLRTTEDAISSGRIEEAMANCQNILTYFPEALEAQRLLGEVYLAQGQMEEAQQTFEWILTNDPENVIVYCDRALISERTSDIDTALDCYQQAYELSRGNASIRQEFNQLSSRVGQQEFMFSRAGLARLYMRGDLLTQAIQEWDAVLSISPDRLDARLGLMETYWREGTYDKAEQVAQRLLEEVPTCLKALLFLAHIASISNIARARDLLVRAQALDPDLAMAQELFADLVASQPNDPFLELLKKEPILLEDGHPVSVGAARAYAQQPQQVPAPLENTYGNWETLDTWDRQTQNGSAPDLPTLESQPWNGSGTDYPTYTPSQPEQPAAWVSQLEQNESSEETAGPPEWLGTLTRGEQAQAPASSFQEPAPLQPPAPAQPSAPHPAVNATPVAPASPTPAAQPEPEDEAMPFFFPSDDEAEGETSWPEWLKSLGAESLEPEQTTPSAPLPEVPPVSNQPGAEISTWETPQAPQAVQPAQVAPEDDPWASLPSLSAHNDAWADGANQPNWMQQISPVELPPAQEAAPDWMQQLPPAQDAPTPTWMQQLPPAQDTSAPTWMQQFSTVQSQSPQQNSTPTWMQQLSQSENQAYQETATPAGTPVNDQEQRYLASLEDLEKSLQSQGFVPMEPGSLAAIAQSQNPPAQQPTAPFPQEAQPSLSSALAQLGNFAQQPTAQSNEPWWNTQNNEQTMPGIPHTPGEQLNPFAALGARANDEAPLPFAPLPATPTPEIAQTLTPAYRSDALLDSDLETTMKRPAITLQPMKPGATPNERGNGKGRGERRPAEHVDESNLSNHERLIRGYQYQLSGAYEEAMQEYRLVIRNAPELLEDVISNLRALLKINPRFSLGYRVLGDAYMRKGEYLQAMESYNKALTMAKKAKN
ncbi:MAG TPA: tetratricopeptide repeat protein [Ktedonobacteraceae bacterium]